MDRNTNLPAFNATLACYGAVFTFVHVFYIMKFLMVTKKKYIRKISKSRYQWPCGLTHGYEAARLMELRVRILPGHGCMSVVSVVCGQVEVSATVRSLV